MKDNRKIYSDAVADAGASFRGIAASDLRRNRDRTTMRAFVAVMAVLWLFGASQFFWGAAWNGLIVVFAAAVIGAAAVFTYLMRGAAAATVAGLLGAATTGWLSWIGGLNWGFLIVGILLSPLAVMAVMAGRSERLQRLPAAVIAAVIAPAFYALSPAVGGWSVPLALIAVTAFVCWQINLPYLGSAKQASKRSDIPMLSTSPFAAGMFGAAAPSGVDQLSLQERVEANQSTAQALRALPANWYVFHSRSAFTGDLIDHVVVGPPGVFVLRSEFAPGALLLDQASTGAEGVPVTNDGERLPMVVSTVLCETAAVVDLQLLTPGGRRVTHAVMVASEAVIDAGVLNQRVIVDESPDQVDWVTPATLVAYLTSAPTLNRGDQFTADLATVLDYQLPPIR